MGCRLGFVGILGREDAYLRDTERMLKSACTIELTPYEAAHILTNFSLPSTELMVPHQTYSGSPHEGKSMFRLYDSIRFI
jgi:hypothetical protein